MFYFTNKKRLYASRYIILVSFCYRKNHTRLGFFAKILLVLLAQKNKSKLLFFTRFVVQSNLRLPLGTFRKFD